MKSLRYTLLATLILCMAAGTGAAHGTGDHSHDNSQGIAAAEAWIGLVDAGSYEKSWDTAAGVFRSALPSAQWAATAAAVRDPLGKLIHRNLFHDKRTSTMPGLPDGDYLMLRFIAKYEHKVSAVETVTLVKESEGKWRVAGYFIK